MDPAAQGCWAGRAFDHFMIFKYLEKVNNSMETFPIVVLSGLDLTRRSHVFLEEVSLPGTLHAAHPTKDGTPLQWLFYECTMMP